MFRISGFGFVGPEEGELVCHGGDTRRADLGVGNKLDMPAAAGFAYLVVLAAADFGGETGGPKGAEFVTGALGARVE